MEPYYSHGLVTLYHADCRDVLPTLEGIETVLTDPPWLASGDSIKRPSGGVADSESMTLRYGELGTFDPEVISQLQEKATHDCLFIVGYKELGQVCRLANPLRGVFGWHKPNGGIAVALPAPLDLAFIVWCGQQSNLYGYQHWKSSVFSIPVPTAGCVTNGERILARDSKKAFHPAQGPIALYRQLLFPTKGVVLDPYAGTGTTLRAAKDLGRQAIGIEINESYCRIAAERLRQEVLF